MKWALLSCLLGLSLAADGAHAATVLTGTLTVDDGFYAYLSTSPTERGDLVASGVSWQKVYKLKPVTLTAGRTYYLHIEAINHPDNAGLIGEFRLSNKQFHFAGGGQDLLTESPDWAGSYNSQNGDVLPPPWVAASGTVFSLGANGVAPWGKKAGINPTAQWIWPTDRSSSPDGPPDVCGGCTVDFSVTITPAG